jgi:hypothetical protein
MDPFTKALNESVDKSAKDLCRQEDLRIRNHVMLRLKFPMSVSSYMKSHLEDCNRIKSVLESAGIAVSVYEAYLMWETYSDRYAAGWLFLPDSDEEILNALTEEC